MGALALLPDSSRVYVGASAADDFLTALDIDIANQAFIIPAGGGRIALEQGAIGIDLLRLSVNPFGPCLRRSPWLPTAVRLRVRAVSCAGKGQIQCHPGDARGGASFLYAFARDGSVRVVNVEVRPEQECDVNVQPNLVGLPPNTGCLPVNRAARRPLAQGPGIRIPMLSLRTAAPPIARDIAVVDLPVTANAMSTNPQALAGQFAFLLASNDAVYILNLAPKTIVNGTVGDESQDHHSLIPRDPFDQPIHG